MNFEKHDNLLLADWTFEGSLLSSKADQEISELEKLLHLSYDLGARGQVQAVLWIQKAFCSDIHQDWLTELSTSLLRDELRWRLGRLYRIRRHIQEAAIPWFYLTEKTCLGTMAELMFACHRRFVFDTETWFGFPEISTGQLPALGWLALHLQRKPKLLDVWQRQSIWKAEEAVQAGLIDAALSWKDWRVLLLPWAQRQIDVWEHETGQQAQGSVRSRPPDQLWSDRGVPLLAKNHLQAYLSRSNRRNEVQTGIDYDLIDSAAHFICQPPYEAWLKRGLQQEQMVSLKSAYELIYADISEATLPISIVSRLLDSGYRICFFAARAETLKQNLEAMLTQIEDRYRKQPLQVFEKQISWYVGESPREPLFPTLAFGSFRNVRFQYKSIDIIGWSLTAQSRERQVIEISQKFEEYARHLPPFFQAVYCVNSTSGSLPLLFIVKSLALQALLNYSQATGEGLLGLLEQLRNLDWNLLGSERHWQRFLDYRQSLTSFSKVSVPESLGRFELDRRVFEGVNWKGLVELSQAKKKPGLRRGPGWLHNYLSSFCADLCEDLVTTGCIKSKQEADLYLADAFGYPESWGSPAIFSQRMGQRRSFYTELQAEVDL